MVIQELPKELCRRDRRLPTCHELVEAHSTGASLTNSSLNMLQGTPAIQKFEAA